MQTYGVLKSLIILAIHASIRKKKEICVLLPALSLTDDNVGSMNAGSPDLDHRVPPRKADYRVILMDLSRGNKGQILSELLGGTVRFTMYRCQESWIALAQPDS